MFFRIILIASIVFNCASVNSSQLDIENFIESKLPPRNLILCSDEIELRLPPIRKLFDTLLQGRNFKIVEEGDVPTSETYLLYIGHPPQSAEKIDCTSSAHADLIELTLIEAGKERPVVDPILLPPGSPPLHIVVGGVDLKSSSGSQARAEFCYPYGNPCGPDLTLMAFNIDLSVCDSVDCKIFAPAPTQKGE